MLTFAFKSNIRRNAAKYIHQNSIKKPSVKIQNQKFNYMYIKDFNMKLIFVGTYLLETGKTRSTKNTFL